MFASFGIAANTRGAASVLQSLPGGPGKPANLCWIVPGTALRSGSGLGTKGGRGALFTALRRRIFFIRFWLLTVTCIRRQPMKSC